MYYNSPETDEDISTSIVWPGSTPSIKVTMGNTCVSIEEFLTAVDNYLRQGEGKYDLLQTFKNQLSRAESYEFINTRYIIERELPNPESHTTPPFEIGGKKISIHQLYTFIWHLLQKPEPLSYSGLAFIKFVRKYKYPPMTVRDLMMVFLATGLFFAVIVLLAESGLLLPLQECSNFDCP